MKHSFYIIGGVIYVDKFLFHESQYNDNHLSKLVGSYTLNLFKPRPRIITGIHSVTIDYSNIESLEINYDDPQRFINELRDYYKSDVRGHIVILQEAEKPQDLLINTY